MTATFTSPTFWLGLAEIAYLNLLLSGDNALVIALAVRALPRRQRILGQIWGAVGAVALRLLFLAIVVYLLELPFVKLVGGAVLAWIAYKLVHSETGVEAEVRHGASVWQAIWIIIVADVMMSLDNVLAIAAAARGDMWLIVCGIGLSLPIVVWGAGWLARLMDRYAWIIWLGGGVLGKVAGEMVLDDTFVHDRIGRIAAPLHLPLPRGHALTLHLLPLALGLIIAILGWRQATMPSRKGLENV
jgi:YjbE family integral membrane protein